MKFQCVPCGSSMKLDHTEKREHGAISLVYACADCGYEMAMVTNPYETQLVASLGADLGDDVAPVTGAAGAAGAAGAELVEGGAAPAPGAGSKCPFTGIAQNMDGDETAATKFPWTAEAEARMAGAPDFVRPIVSAAIERFARENGYTEVNEKVIEEAKSFLGM